MAIPTTDAPLFHRQMAELQAQFQKNFLSAMSVTSTHQNTTHHTYQKIPVQTIEVPFNKINCRYCRCKMEHDASYCLQCGAPNEED